MQNKENLAGRDGCCLSCTEFGDCDTPCFNCVCGKCDLFFPISDGNKCYYRWLKKDRRCYSITLLKETEKAYKIHFIDMDISTWIPKSQIGFLNITKMEFTNVNKITIPNWLAEEKGIEPEGWEELGGLRFSEFDRLYLTDKEDWRY